MKLKLLAGLMLMCSSVAASACNSVDGGDDGTIVLPSDAAGTGTITASIAGTPLTASGADNVIVSVDGNSFVMVANTATGAQLSIGVNGVSKTGTYSLGAGGVGTATYTTSGAGWLSTLSGGSGSITFSTLTTLSATGTFSFTGAPITGTAASGTKVVTAGTFSVTFAK